MAARVVMAGPLGETSTISGLAARKRSYEGILKLVKHPKKQHRAVNGA
jgi:hypothetical protein